MTVIYEIQELLASETNTHYSNVFASDPPHSRKQ
jgi:hypothetical protein